MICLSLWVGVETRYIPTSGGGNCPCYSVKRHDFSERLVVNGKVFLKKNCEIAAEH